MDCSTTPAGREASAAILLGKSREVNFAADLIAHAGDLAHRGNSDASILVGDRRLRGAFQRRLGDGSCHHLKGYLPDHIVDLETPTSWKL